MNKTRITYPVFILAFVLLIILSLTCYTFFKTNIIMLDNKPDGISTSNDFPYISGNIVENADDAVDLAKTYIKIIYHEPVFLHGPYYVYYDDESQLFYISANGKLFHAGVDIIIYKATGGIVGSAVKLSFRRKV